MIGMLLGAALLWMPTTATAARSDDLAAFEAAVADKDLPRAFELANQLVEARTGSGKPGPDPWLNGIVGRAILLGGDGITARGYLEAAGSADYPALTAAEVQLARAESQALTHDSPAAEASYRALGSMQLTPDQKRRFLQGLAGQMLADQPGEAARLLQAEASAWSSAPSRWQHDLLLGQALHLSGDRNAGDAALDRAWANAPSAPADDHAVSRVALARAAAFAQRRDAEGLRAMLQIAGADTAMLSDKVAAALPLCGIGDIRPEDHVLFMAYRHRGRTELSPVTASRPGIAEAFGTGFAQTPMFESTPRAGFEGTVFTARCRQELGGGGAGGDPSQYRYATWGARNGYFPILSIGDELGDINRMADRVAAMEERLGSEHPALLMPRMSVYPRLAMRAKAHGDVPQPVLDQLLRSIRAAIGRDAELNRLLPQSSAWEAKFKAATTPAEGAAVQRAYVLELIATAPTDIAYWHALPLLEEPAALPAADRLKIVRTLIERMDPARDRDRLSRLYLRKAGLERGAGDIKAAMGSYRKAGVSPDVCVAAEAQPAMDKAGFSDDNYPGAAMKSELSGSSFLEHGLDASGTVAGVRHILSVPALLFDEAAEKSLRASTFKPARRGNRPVACRSRFVRVRWVLPEADEEQSSEDPEQALPLDETS